MNGEELDQVAELFASNWQCTYPGIVPAEYLAWLTPATAKNTWHKYLEEERHFILVARTVCTEQHAATKVVGMAAAQAEYYLPKAGYLAALHIAPEFRGKGLGKQLIKAVAERLREYGINQLALAVIDGNDAALSVYKHLGAKVVDYREANDGFTSNDYILLWDDTEQLCGI